MPLDSLLLYVFELFTKKSRDTTADRLENNNVANESFPETFKRYSRHIKTKLHNLSKIDLCSSLDYMEEGFLQLSECINEVERNRKYKQGSNNENSQATCTAITNRYELSIAIQRSNVFESAKKRFEKSRVKATRAFNNRD